MSATSQVSVQTLPDARLLREFAQSDSRAAFTEIVAQYAGLVLAAAQRITGDRSMAEEAAQNVFAILARKASAVAKLPHVAGWLHQTAVFEARKRLRSETRHRRKLAAFSATMNDPAGSGPESRRDDILPHVDECIQRLRPEEQQAIRMRYLEERSYADIAAALGKSEEAGKKQTARAMERLCVLLRRRGVVSAAALGSALSAGARTASALPAGPLASAALAAAPAVSRIALLVHTLQTMNHTRTALTAGVIIALCAAPVIWQESAIARTRAELVRVEAEHARDGKKPPALSTASPLPSPPAAAALALPAAEGPLTIEMVAEIAEKIRTGIDHSTDIGRRYLQLKEMNATELQGLLAETASLGGDVKRKERTRIFLVGQLGTKDPAAAVRAGTELYSQLSEESYGPEGIESVLSGVYVGWFKTDFRAALASFETLRDAGAFHGRGIHQTGDFLTDAVTGEAYAYSREDALRLYRMLDEDNRANAITKIAFVAQPEDRDFVVAEAMGGQKRHQIYILGALLKGEASRRGPDAAATLLKQLDLTSEVRVNTVADMLDTVTTARPPQSTAEALQWARQHLSAEECAAAAGRWLAETSHLPPGNTQKNGIAALRAFDWGSARDTAIAAFFSTDEKVREPGEAASLAIEITDHAKKVEVLRKIASSPLRPSDAVAQIVNQDPSLTGEDRLHILKR
jgi:RNA polymerase sigma factor (sigma-70 family)